METAALRIVSNIRVVLDIGHVSLLLLDMSEAFDTVDHDILIGRIKHLQFAKCRRSGLEHTFHEEVKKYYLHLQAMLNSPFN